MSYIHTGHMTKYLNAPKPTFSDVLLDLQDEIDRLHEEYDILRCSDNRTWMPRPLSNDVRKLGKKLAAAQKRYNDLFDAENPEYVTYWRN